MKISEGIIFAIIMLMAMASNAGAQGHSAGMTWSFSGIGISYERMIDDDAFIRTGVQLEMAETFLGKRGETGVSFSVTRNSILAQTTSRNGNAILFHAGPGIMGGYCRDYQLRREQAAAGVAFGLEGRVGMTIVYERKVNISLCVAPVIGMHVTRDDEYNPVIRYYRYGLLKAIMPEIGIKYRF